MTLDPIAVHVIETTASAGAQYARTPWASTIAYVVANRQLIHETRMLIFARRAHMRSVAALLQDLKKP